MAAWLTDSSPGKAAVVADWQAFLLVSVQTLTRHKCALVRDYFAQSRHIRVCTPVYVCMYDGSYEYICVHNLMICIFPRILFEIIAFIISN